MKTQSKYINGLKRGKTREQVAIGFSFAFDWLRKWREFSRPITERSKLKPLQSGITLDTQVKISLKQSGDQSDWFACRSEDIFTTKRFFWVSGSFQSSHASPSPAPATNTAC